MKASKSVNSLLASSAQQHYTQMVSNSSRRPQPPEPQRVPPRPAADVNMNSSSAPTSPICRCRVMYLGSSVPHITKDGLQGIQEPLRELYPDQASLDSGNAGIDSWLSVWSNGILIENVDETGREMKRFFKIEALHYCAAVKYIPQADGGEQAAKNTSSTLALSDKTGSTGSNLPKFLPLDSPHARVQQFNSNPPIFASILRRTTGVKVLECHAFVCKRETAANALVRCCFHAYADTMYAKQIGADIDNISAASGGHGRPLGQAQTLRRPHGSTQKDPTINGGMMNTCSRSKSIAALNESTTNCDYSDSNNHTNDSHMTNNYSSSIMRTKSMNENGNQMKSDDISSDNSQQQRLASSNNLRNQYHLSKSMHQLNQAAEQYTARDVDYVSELGSHSASIHNLATSKARWSQSMGQSDQSGQPVFYNPCASRVPSYPPQNFLDQQEQKQQHHNHHKQMNGSDTIRSIKSVAANSIASTLLRSKKHAKAMSAAQMSAQQQQQEFNNRLPGFHQPHMNGSATLAPSQSFMMPPVPPMFLPRLPIVNGSQTMKLPKHHQQQFITAPYPQQTMNFEAMTPKELKKLLKKSAKYGLDATNGLPVLPINPRAMPPPIPYNIPAVPPHSLQSNKSGTINSQSFYSMDQAQQHGAPDVVDLATGLPQVPTSCIGAPSSSFNHPDQMSPNIAPVKSILVKPNPEFLKSKAGKKWLKQQKEFKKLLPPHLDGLPIVFGPPPMDALEPANKTGDLASNGVMPSPAFLQPTPSGAPPHGMGMAHPGLPMMDTNGYYSQPAQPMYLLPSGRASTASTLMRHSPHSVQQHAMDQPEPYGHNINGHQPGALLGPNMSMPPMVNNHRGDGSFSSMISADHLGRTYAAHPMTETLDENSRQYVFKGPDPAAYHGRRKHMIEQSVISLGDENEGDDDDDEQENDSQIAARLANGNGNRSGENDDDDDGQMNGYYNRVASLPQQQYRDDQQNYEQVMPPPPLPQNHNASSCGDDQSSYSSGIYRRGHINERAFSYSIRQEHKSGTQKPNANSRDHSSSSAGQYSQQLANYNNNQKHHQMTSMYDNPQHQQMMYHSVHGDNRASGINNGGRHVDDLTTSLENQLSMRSFANSSRVRSHM